MVNYRSTLYARVVLYPRLILSVTANPLVIVAGWSWAPATMRMPLPLSPQLVSVNPIAPFLAAMRFSSPLHAR